MKDRFKSLDGWRGLSIIFVLCGHLLPLGPKSWQLNGAVAASGMVLFFILSGFLITTILIKNQNVFHFLIRRFLRIIPLAWLIILITFISVGASYGQYVTHLFFYANWEPIALIPSTSHLWSLCVEMQFYVGIALLIMVLKTRAFPVLFILCLAITSNRYLNGVHIAINTYFRVDEILAGCILAIIYSSDAEKIKHYLGQLSVIYLLPLLIISAHPWGGGLNYFRPYIAMVLIGSTLFNEKFGEKWLRNRFLFYMASTSYALYVIHGGLSHTWLGSGESLEKYIKRPLLFAATFLLAHLSTFYFEKHWINLGKKLTSGKQSAS